MTDLAISDLLPSGIDLKDSTQWKCTIYQFESCPFCRKVRSCLDYLRIPYEVSDDEGKLLSAATSGCGNAPSLKKGIKAHNRLQKGSSSCG